MALLREKFEMPRARAAKIVGLTLFVFGLPVIFFLKHGYMDQYDFWIGTILLAFLATCETLVFVFAFSRSRVLGSGVKSRLVGYVKFGLDAGWEEMNRSAEMKIPRVFYYVLKYFVPFSLIVLFCGWLWQDLRSETSVVLIRGIDSQHKLFRWIARLTIIGVILGVGFLVKLAWRRRK